MAAEPMQSLSGPRFGWVGSTSIELLSLEPPSKLLESTFARHARRVVVAEDVDRISEVLFGPAGLPGALEFVGHVLLTCAAFAFSMKWVKCWNQLKARSAAVVLELNPPWQTLI
jgi:hypothetical protein